MLFYLGQHLPKALQFILAQIPLPFNLAILGHMAAGIGAIRAQAPNLGKIEHLGQHAQRSVGLIRLVAEFLMQAGDVLALQIHHFEIADGRGNEQINGAAVFALDGRLAVLFGMGRKEPTLP
ncbi:hypothetical protein [Pseudophaeobacter sp.]|uniref:hypothetical protein n=1 Tax=Pseudophaeobacter sp. TaxID=1971739 RepID=UPI004058EBB1